MEVGTNIFKILVSIYATKNITEGVFCYSRLKAKSQYNFFIVHLVATQSMK